MQTRDVIDLMNAVEGYRSLVNHLERQLDVKTVQLQDAQRQLERQDQKIQSLHRVIEGLENHEIQSPEVGRYTFLLTNLARR